MTTTATFSDLLRKPKDVLANLEEADIVVTRRDGADIRIGLDSTAHADEAMVGAFAAMIGSFVRKPEVAETLIDALHGPFPWMEFLSAEGRREFAHEFLRVARSCASIGNFKRLSLVVADWQETASLQAAGAESSPADDVDLQPVPDPRTA